ncbi:MAG: hypothetical protein IJ058_12040 [Lachnospiraceae bacterium]|nr:hypothetical protein [Lachnospiraceae bacterium]
MKKLSNYKFILSLLVSLILMVFVGIVFDYYYEFNDDVLMKDILSGAYMGYPSALNVQMLAPISFCFSLLYRITGAVPWYGLFLVGIQYLCVFLVIQRSLEMADRISGIASTVLISVLFCLDLLLPHLVMVQYTVTVSFMAGAAGFLIVTIPAGLERKEFLKHAVIPVVLIVLGFQLRSEMMVLMLPYVCVAAVSSLVRDRRGLSSPYDADRDSGKDKMSSSGDPKSGILISYIIAVSTAFLLMLISFGIDKAAYSGPDWKAFLDEFDARTELYDYQFIPDHNSENITFYEQEGISGSQVRLLQIYDYGIDDRINADMMRRVASYAEELRSETFSLRLRQSFHEYFYRILHFSDGVYVMLVFVLYVIVIMAMCIRRDMKPSDRLLLLFSNIIPLALMRSVAWIFIIYGRREPARIVHSLYIIEAMLLFGMLLNQISCRIKDRAFFKMTSAVLLIICGLLTVPGTYSGLQRRVSAQDEINGYAKAIDEYCMDHPGNFYWEDVYSTIIDGETFNEKIFVPSTGKLKNYDIIGGWAMNSPLLGSKLAHYGIEDIGQSLLDADNVFVIISDEYDGNWISDHYDDIGIDVRISPVDRIANRFTVYRVD